MCAGADVPVDGRFVNGYVNLGDYYPPYNRPKAISLWLEDVQPEEEWVIVLDPDMLISHPVEISKLGVPDGFALGSPYEFLTGEISVHYWVQLR